MWIAGLNAINVNYGEKQIKNTKRINPLYVSNLVKNVMLDRKQPKTISLYDLSMHTLLFELIFFLSSIYSLYLITFYKIIDDFQFYKFLSYSKKK